MSTGKKRGERVINQFADRPTAHQFYRQAFRSLEERKFAIEYSAIAGLDRTKRASIYETGNVHADIICEQTDMIESATFLKSTFDGIGAIGERSNEFDGNGVFPCEEGA